MLLPHLLPPPNSTSPHARLRLVSEIELPVTPCGRDTLPPRPPQRPHAAMAGDLEIAAARGSTATRRGAGCDRGPYFCPAHRDTLAGPVPTRAATKHSNLPRLSSSRPGGRLGADGRRIRGGAGGRPNMASTPTWWWTTMRLMAGFLIGLTPAAASSSVGRTAGRETTAPGPLRDEIAGAGGQLGSRKPCRRRRRDQGVGAGTRPERTRLDRRNARSFHHERLARRAHGASPSRRTRRQMWSQRR